MLRLKGPFQWCGPIPATSRVLKVNGHSRPLLLSLFSQHSHARPITMANRQGYDVVVDVDAEVCVLDCQLPQHHTQC